MMVLYSFLGLIFFLQISTLVSGHGNMVLPLAWWDKEQVGWAYNTSNHGYLTHIGCNVLDLPRDTEFDAQANDNQAADCLQYWFTNDVIIPGDATLSPEMLVPDNTCNGNAGNNNQVKFPWNAPGTAPVLSPCGTMGGMPKGCNADGEGAYGDCCAQQCGIFAFGNNTEDYPWPDMPITEWYAGFHHEVAWYVTANHGGGYSYRLCPMPEGGISELTEECFQQTPLDFVGESQWVNYEIDRETGHRTEVQALQTTEGTFPKGSMWRANPILPENEEAGSEGFGRGHIVDLVDVPADLEPGEYVVSFR